MKGIVVNDQIMIIANINSQTWPQTKWVISMTIFQVVVIVLFCIFVRYDPSLDAKSADPKKIPEYDDYPCKSIMYIAIYVCCLFLSILFQQNIYSDKY